MYIARIRDMTLPSEYPFQSALARVALAAALLSPVAALSQMFLPIGNAPPPLPIYAQPPVPGDGYIWAPGYWAWNQTDSDYYWVPGTWVLAPNEGDLWTPGYWSFDNGGYIWYPGYWGSEVGFYGGLNYGYGYTGWGYQGGRWDQGSFWYNRAVSNIGATRVRHVYSVPLAQGGRAGRLSFNGKTERFTARPTGAERQFQASEHPDPIADQVSHERAALRMPEQRHGAPRVTPLVAATPRPSAFTMPGVEHERATMGSAARQPSSSTNRGGPTVGARQQFIHAGTPHAASQRGSPPARGR